MPTVSRPGRPPFPAVAGLGIAAGLIAVSYGHIYDVAAGAGAAMWEAAIIAATVDGLIVMALATIALARRHAVKPPAIAKVALVVGVMATGAANLHHGIAYGWTGVAVALWVPLVAEVAYLVAMAALRITQAADVSAPTADRPDICGHHIPVPAVMVRVAVDRAPVMAAEPAVTGEESPVIAATRPATVRPRPAQRQAVTADVTAAREAAVMEWLAAADTRPATATGADIAALLAERDLGTVSVRTGRRILAAVRESLGELATASV